MIYSKYTPPHGTNDVVCKSTKLDAEFRFNLFLMFPFFLFYVDIDRNGARSAYTYVHTYAAK